MADAHARRGVALGVEVDDQDPVVELGQGRAEVHRGRGLADAAFLVRDRDHQREDDFFLGLAAAGPQRRERFRAAASGGRRSATSPRSPSRGRVRRSTLRVPARLAGSVVSSAGAGFGRGAISAFMLLSAADPRPPNHVSGSDPGRARRQMPFLASPSDCDRTAQSDPDSSAGRAQSLRRRRRSRTVRSRRIVLRVARENNRSHVNVSRETSRRSSQFADASRRCPHSVGCGLAGITPPASVQCFT